MVDKDEAANKIAEAIGGALTEAVQETDFESVIKDTLDELDVETTDVSDGGPMEIGRAVVEEENITTTDFFEFRSAMLDNDVDDDTVSEVWDDLRDEGAIPKGSPETDEQSTEDTEPDEETETAVDTDQEADETTDDDGPTLVMEDSGGADNFIPEGEPGSLFSDPIPVETPFWVQFPEDLQVQPLGVGDDFITDPCSRGDDAVLWYAGDITELDNLRNAGTLAPSQSTGGGQLRIPFERNPMSKINNVFVDSDTLEGRDSALVVGIHVCEDETAQDGLVETQNEWNQTSENAWNLLNALPLRESAVYLVAKARGVPDGAPEPDEAFDVFSQIGFDPDGQQTETDESDADTDADDEDTEREGTEIEAVTDEDVELDAELTRDYDPGQGVLLTRPDCPACQALKQRDNIQNGLESGELINVTPQDADWEAILAQTGVEVVPTLVAFDPEAGKFVNTG